MQSSNYFNTIYARCILLTLIKCILFTSLYGQESLLLSSIELSQKYLQTGDLIAASKEIDKAIQLEPKNFNAYIVRAAIRSKQQDIDGLLFDYDKIVELSPPTFRIETIYINRSSILLRKGEIEKALLDTDKAIELNPNIAEAYIMRGVIRLLKNDFNKSLRDYEKSIEINPKIAAAYFGRGYFRYQYSEFEKAIEDYDKAIELNPNYGDAYANRGIIHGLNGNFSKSLTDLTKALEINPNSITNAPRGVYKSPFIELNDFIVSNSKNSKAYFLRGILYKLSGKEKESVKDFEKAAEIDPKLGSDIKIMLKSIELLPKTRPR